MKHQVKREWEPRAPYPKKEWTPEEVEKLKALSIWFTDFERKHNRLPNQREINEFCSREVAA